MTAFEDNRFLFVGQKIAIGGDWYVLDSRGREDAVKGRRIMIKSEDGKKTAIVSAGEIRSLPSLAGVVYITWSHTFFKTSGPNYKYWRDIPIRADRMSHYSLTDAIRRLRTLPADTRGIHYILADRE